MFLVYSQYYVFTSLSIIFSYSRFFLSLFFFFYLLNSFVLAALHSWHKGIFARFFYFFVFHTYMNKDIILFDLIFFIFNIIDFMNIWFLKNTFARIDR